MPDLSPRVLQQFARLPVPGEVKTRLLCELSAQEACAVHEELLLQTAATLCDAGLAPVELWLDRSGASAAIDRALARGVRGPCIQSAGDLGERMHHALAQGLTRAAAVVLVGSDCPGLCKSYLREAFAALESHDVVLGPAEDGGFVLIGCRRIDAAVFAGVSWGGEGVLAATLSGLSALGLSAALLEPRFDVDTPRDLRRWRGEISGVRGD